LDVYLIPREAYELYEPGKILAVPVFAEAMRIELKALLAVSPVVPCQMMDANGADTCAVSAEQEGTVPHANPQFQCIHKVLSGVLEVTYGHLQENASAPAIAKLRVQRAFASCLDQQV
jgi:hypothetical protein